MLPLQEKSSEMSLPFEAELAKGKRMSAFEGKSDIPDPADE